MQRIVAVSLLVIGMLFVILSVLQHMLVLKIHVDHIAVVFLVLGMVGFGAGAGWLAVGARRGSTM